jgi:hypothetical protein
MGAQINSLCLFICAVPALIYMWINKRPAPLGVKIFTTFILLLLIVIEFYFPVRWALSVYIAVFITLLLAICVCWVRPINVGDSVIIWIFLLLKLFFMLIPQTFRYAYENRVLFPFWYVFVIMGVCLSLAITPHCKSKYQKKGASNQIGNFLIWALVISLLLCCSCNILNHALDNSEPQVIEVIVLDHDAHSSYKSRATWELVVSICDEIYHIEVPYRVYCQYTVGDTYRVYRYEGAFNQPFYLAEAYAMP